MTRRRGISFLLPALTLTLAVPLTAIVQPEETPLRAKIFRHEDLSIRAHISAAGGEQAPALAALGVAPEGAYLDARTGRWATLMPARPLLPGKGVGNELTWEALAVEPPGDGEALRRLAWDALVGYLEQHRGALRFDVGELAAPGNVAVHDGGGLIQIYAPRRVAGIPVRDSYLTAVLRHGNLVLLGASRWSDVAVAPKPAVSADQAIANLRSYLGPLAVRSSFRKSSLAFVPVAAGEGLGYRLAWVLRPVIPGDLGTWEALVDAASGELLAFEDLNHYATARVVEGGVLPESNDGMGPEGMEQPGWPMPFADLLNAGETLFTDEGGNLLACVDGEITTTLSGRYMSMSDNCGAVSESTTGDVLDLGTSGGTDCVVPLGASPGNTHSSRSGFYEMNRIKEQARGQLPANSWLAEQLTANMNIPDICNAFWDGSTVNFFRSGGGCGNTGELAGVYDHEWGHGMDDNDVLPTISDPGEGVPDAYTYLRLNTSCIGRGFFMGGACNGYGDPCVGSPPCDGVRDIDWANRSSGAPHDLDWIDPNCPFNPVGANGPCGGLSHCEGAAQAEAVFDLVNRDLPSFFGMDFNTAHEIGTRLTYLGGGAVGSWFTCSPPFGGCNADGGYLNFLAVDDDNGSLADGTPHMSAIFAAFDRHQIACGAPTVADSGCAGGPTTAPAVAATAQDRGASLTWGAVAGASKYKVYRTDGVFACDFGKILVGETTGTSFVDVGLKNGREYYYVVIPFGPDDACFGTASSCTAVTPAAGANLAVAELPASLSFLSGDGDVFLDNCEQLEVGVEVSNIGTGTQTNVRIVAVEGVDNPEIAVVTQLPAAVDSSMTACEIVERPIVIQAEGLSLNDPIAIRVAVTSDQLAPQTRSQIVPISLFTEGDFQSFATKTFSFETDLEGWQLVEDTFGRTTTGPGSGGGAPPTDHYVASSTFLSDQCDNIRSPVLSLTATSTMTLWNNFNIEPFCTTCNPPSWYDRANVGVFDVGGGTRTLVEPSVGRTYNASGFSPNVTFCTNGETGWAGDMQSWATSTFDATDLDAGAIAGDLIQLDIRYGTDEAFELDGFWFDEVTLTDVDVQVGDGQPDMCLGVGLIFTDGFESGDLSAWTSSTP